MNKELIDLISDIITDIDPVTCCEAHISWTDADKAAEKILRVLWEQGVLVHEEPSN